MSSHIYAQETLSHRIYCFYIMQALIIQVKLELSCVFIAYIFPDNLVLQGVFGWLVNACVK